MPTITQQSQAFRALLRQVEQAHSDGLAQLDDATTALIRAHDALQSASAALVYASDSRKSCHGTIEAGTERAITLTRIATENAAAAVLDAKGVATPTRIGWRPAEPYSPGMRNRVLQDEADAEVNDRAAAQRLTTDEIVALQRRETALKRLFTQFLADVRNIARPDDASRLDMALHDFANNFDAIYPNGVGR